MEKSFQRYAQHSILAYQNGVFPMMNLAARVVTGTTDAAREMKVEVNYECLHIRLI